MAMALLALNPVNPPSSSTVPDKVWENRGKSSARSVKMCEKSWCGGLTVTPIKDGLSMASVCTVIFWTCLLFVARQHQTTTKAKPVNERNPFSISDSNPKHKKLRNAPVLVLFICFHVEGHHVKPFNLFFATYHPSADQSFRKKHQMRCSSDQMA